VISYNEVVEGAQAAIQVIFFPTDDTKPDPNNEWFRTALPTSDAGREVLLAVKVLIDNALKESAVELKTMLDQGDVPHAELKLALDRYVKARDVWRARVAAAEERWASGK